MHSSVRAGESRRPGKALLKRPGSGPPASCEQFGAAQAGPRHSVGTTSSRGRAGGQHQLLGPPGQRQPQAAERCQDNPSGWVGHIWPCGGSRKTSWSPGLQGQSSEVLRQSAFFRKIWKSRPGVSRGHRAGPMQPLGTAPCSLRPALSCLTSLRMTHTGESVWMERRSASRGPKAGSTSPSATPLWKEPGDGSAENLSRDPCSVQPPPLGLPDPTHLSGGSHRGSAGTGGWLSGPPAGPPCRTGGSGGKTKGLKPGLWERPARCAPTRRPTHIEGQHLHRRVEELVLWVLDVSAAEEEPAARQACELLQVGAQAHCPAEKRPGWALGAGRRWAPPGAAMGCAR